MIRRDRVLLGLAFSAVAGVCVLFGSVTWVVWDESVRAEERRLEQLARTLGETVETSIVEAREILGALNDLDVAPCSAAHLAAMQDRAITRPHIRAIGYWRAAERLCGAGFVQGRELTPPRADRIYESGVVAWWPGTDTEIGGVQFFLMRFGAHDVVIDPRALLDGVTVGGGKAGLWVEGLRMASRPWGVELPEPGTLEPGLTINRADGEVVSRFSIGTIFPIDIVAVDSIDTFWERYLPVLLLAAAVGVVLVAVWIYVVFRVSRRHLSLGAELREAVRQDRLFVVYQPIVDLATARIVGAEVLVRWRREGGNVVNPDVFIPVAESEGILCDVTQRVLDKAMQELGGTIRRDPEFRININVTREDLEHGELPDRLARTVAAAGLPPGSVNVEITERSLVASSEASSVIQRIRRQGHAVSVDDFGTGYSNLAYLQRFELDSLKIDKTFVDTIGSGAANADLVTRIIEMAHSLELETVAEGIEHLEQVKWLLAHGVSRGQGFLFGRPMDVGSFKKTLARSKSA